MGNRQDEKFQISKDSFLTQNDKTEIFERIECLRTDLSSNMYKTVYTAGLIQLLAIIVSVLLIIS